MCEGSGVGGTSIITEEGDQLMERQFNFTALQKISNEMMTLGQTSPPIIIFEYFVLVGGHSWVGNLCFNEDEYLFRFYFVIY